VQKLRLLIACCVVLVATLVPLTASAVPPNAAEATATFEYTQNMHPLGYSARVVETDNTLPGSGSFNSDLAFWGKTAVQGTYAGFRLIDVSAPGNPKEIINWEECNSLLNTQGNQGDVIIWEDLIIRSWNSPAPASGSMCGDMPVAPGEEGVHIIDISNPREPDVIGFVDIPCGSHTETLVPDLENDRLLVYSNSSANTIFGTPVPPESPPTCRGIDIIEVPLDDPASASYLRFEPTGHEDDPPENLHSCHDTGVILGDANLVACAGQTSATGGNGVTVFSVDPAMGGSKENPMFLYHKTTGGISLGHSASFTWDGEIIIVGHEPGGGSGANCEATDNPLERTFFYVDADTGASIGQFTIPRPQTNVENCTTHNYNVVPTDKRYVMVSGNYQSGISVIDFTDPASAEEIAYADPAPLVDPNPPVGIELGGDWSSYWYNGRIYESDITRGLIIWDLSDKAVAGARKLDHLNPQTQESTID
jgi:LVIVD repeat-containing protein